MTEHSSLKDVPGLHFKVKEGLETNIKLSGSVNANPDVAQVVNGQAQTVMVDELGFIWRTASENFNIVRSARVIGLDLQAKLDSLTKKVRKYSRLNPTTKSIYVVKHNDKLLDCVGRDIPMEKAQDALWLRGDGIASLSHAKVALRKLLNIESKEWSGHVHEKKNFELVKIMLNDSLEITNE